MIKAWAKIADKHKEWKVEIFWRWRNKKHSERIDKNNHLDDSITIHPSKIIFMMSIWILLFSLLVQDMRVLDLS